MADALSRCQVASVTEILSGIDYSAIAKAQKEDAEVEEYRTVASNLKLEDVPFGPVRKTILCDISLGQPRPVIPRAFRKVVFDAMHSLSHPSIRTSQKLVTSKFVWFIVRKDVGTWAKQCLPCHTSKIQKHIRAPIQVCEVPHRRFGHISIDIVGPLPESRGYRYLLTMLYRFTGWPEAILIVDTTADTCARALIFNWIT